MPNSKRLQGNVIKDINFGSNGARKDKIIPDYTGDYYWASIMAKRIQNFWHKKGYHQIRAWVETDVRPSGSKIFSVRSNISFDVSDLSRLLN